MTDEITYCAVHPDRETGLRCNKCERYMCSACAVQTPVGYRCRECVRQVEDRFYNAAATDSLIAFGICAAVALGGGLVLGYVGRLGLLIGLLAGFPAGFLMANWTMQAIKRRKGRNLWRWAAGGVVVGALVGAYLGGLMAYPDSLREAYEIFQQMPPAQQDGIRRGGLRVISQSDFALQRVLTLGVIAFAGLSAYSVYLRMKS